jgi:hypothetical protein
MLLPIGVAIIMGGSLTMVGNSPLILLNDLLVSANSPTCPRAWRRCAASRCSRRCRSASPCCWPAALLFRPVRAPAAGRRRGQGRHAGAHRELLRQGLRHRGEIFELTVTADSPLVGMSIGEAEAQHGRRCCLR